MNSSIISYRTGAYKALFLPTVGAEVVFDDLVKYSTAIPAEMKTSVRLRRDAQSLHLAVTCYDSHPEKIHAGNTANGMSVWSGDLLEIFFGSMEGTPFQHQYAIAAGGGRFDSTGNYDLWNAKTAITSDGWTAEADFPYSFFNLKNGRLAFNICRQIPEYGFFFSFAQITYGFDEIANHADLFFCDTPTAWMLLSGQTAPEALTSENFCQMVEKHSIPAGTVTDAPRLINPAPTQMSVIWRTAGLCAGAVDIRKAGSTEWKRVTADILDGVAAQNSTLHRVDLCDLEANTPYEYRVASLHYVDEARHLLYPENGVLTFRTFAAHPTSFSCGIFSDIHSQKHLLNKWLAMPQFTSCDFHIQLGDLLAALVCTNAIFQNVLSAFTDACPAKPLVMVRGNHDQERHFAADYSRLNNQEKRSYGLFSNGDVCFMVLDTGNDHVHDPLGIRVTESLTASQVLWIDEAVKTPQWTGAACRIVLMHIPPNISTKYPYTPSMCLAEHLTAAAVKPQLVLAGHHHEYARLLPGQPAWYQRESSSFLNPALALPFPLIVNGNNTALLLKYNAGGHFELTALDEDGRIIDLYTAGRATRELRLDF